MNLANIGNPQYVYLDKNGKLIREGLWYLHSTIGAIKVMGLSDIKLDYQTVDMQNSSIYKVVSGYPNISEFFNNCKCTGFIPNGKVINPDMFDNVDTINEFERLTTIELIEELTSRGAIKLINRELNLYQIK